MFAVSLLEAVRAAQRVVVLTGAGISAESGIPTFRDAMEGMWSRFRPEDLASPQGFRRDPQQVWAWYAERRGKVLKCQPNPGHVALADWQRRCAELLLVTQNVDRLHQRAGAQNVHELHGNLYEIKCTKHGAPSAWPEPIPDMPPTCPHCGDWLRPNVVWFGEALPMDVFEAASQAVPQADLCVVIGTSGLVYPAAHLPLLALQSQVPVLEINKETTDLSQRAQWFLQGASGQLLPQLLRAAFPED
ncbi:MAG: NAD-dependent deacylase [Acidobacteria bacterium]|nr:NAD-dependent deacylase [Acidobacteriota bacterium]